MTDKPVPAQIKHTPSEELAHACFQAGYARLAVTIPAMLDAGITKADILARLRTRFAPGQVLNDIEAELDYLCPEPFTPGE